MSPFIAVLFAYSLIAFFFCILVIAVFFVHAIREIELRKREQTRKTQILEKGALRHVLIYLYSPLQEMPAWNDYHELAEDTVLPHRTGKVIPGPVILPLRYEQTLLYADELSEQAARVGQALVSTKAS